MDENLRKTILKWALKNAVDHDGKAAIGPVISKLVAEDPSIKNRIREIRGIVEEVVNYVNGIPPEEQERMLGEIAPELLRHETRREEKKLPPLPGAVKGQVVTRLPPEPSGYMHIGHAMSGLLNYLYAEMYDGKLWLRFEDTNPRKVRLEYYESFRKGYRWLGIEWDYEKNNSDDMKLYYEYAEKLIKMNKLYLCTCSPDEMSMQRREMKTCIHRSQGVEENLELWSKMINGEFKEGEIAVRLAGDMSSKNTAMRDPVMFRVVDHPHPLLGKDYIVWPTYDFAVAIQDAICGITHVLRSSEFAFRDELQNYIRSLLGLRNPVIIEYSRFEFRGTPTSKRLIRPLIESRVVWGWDDPRLATVEGIRRRGILPEAIREFTITQTGFSYAKRVYDWSLLFSINRKLLDPKARRFFFVPHPIELKVDGLEKEVEIPYHPTYGEYGRRKLKASNRVFISRWDLDRLRDIGEFRLKHLANIRIRHISDNFAEGEITGFNPREGLQIIQWVGEEKIEAKVYRPGELFRDGEEVNMDSMEEIVGYVEENAVSIDHGEIVQFERFGFCRRDSKDEMKFIFTHE